MKSQIRRSVSSVYVYLSCIMHQCVYTCFFSHLICFHVIAVKMNYVCCWPLQRVKVTVQYTHTYQYDEKKPTELAKIIVY